MSSRKHTARQGLTPDLIREWDEVNVLSLPKEHRDRFQRRVTAIKLYAEQESAKEIAAQTGISRQELDRFVKRTLIPYPDGKTAGFRALVPYKQGLLERNANPEKLKARNPKPGALSALFCKFPTIHTAMRAAAIDGVREGVKHKDQDMAPSVLHQYLLDLCDNAGITYPHYPFVEGREKPTGLAAIRRWANKIRTEEALSRAQHSDDPAVRRTADDPGPESQSLLRANRYYQRCEFDGHFIDCPLFVETQSMGGDKRIYLKVNRIWIIAGIELKSTAVLGYALALGKNYSSRDVVRAVQNCLKPWQRRKLTVSTVTYRDGEGMPSGAIPELAFTCFDEISFDNAMAHRADYLVSFLERTTQTVPVWSPVAAPNTHPYVEGFFSLLEELGIHLMPTTYGSSPADARRKRKIDERYHLSYELLADMIDLLVCRINGLNAPGAEQSRLELLTEAVKRRSFMPRHIPEESRSRLLQFDICEEGMIGRDHGRPVVRFEGARYDNRTLRRALKLIGRPVTIFASSTNLQTIEVSLEDGTALGVMKCEPRWAETPHSLDVRREINRRLNDGSFVPKGSDIVVGFKIHLEAESKASKRSARWLAKMVVEGNQNDPSPSMTPDNTDDDDIFDGYMAADEEYSATEPDELKGLNTIFRK